jgi:hypothetical protein
VEANQQPSSSSDKNSKAYYEKHLVGSIFYIKTEIVFEHTVEQKYLILDVDFVKEHFYIKKECGIKLYFYNFERNTKTDFIYPQKEIDILIEDKLLVEEDFIDTTHIKITTMLF